MNDVLIMKDLLKDSPSYLIGLMRSSLVEFGNKDGASAFECSFLLKVG